MKCKYNPPKTNCDFYYIGKGECILDVCEDDYTPPREKKHKCDGCPWGTFTGIKYKCALPRCMPKLGSSNGVDKNGQTKKNS